MTEYIIPLCFDHQSEHAEQIYSVLVAEGYKPRRDSTYIRVPHDAIRTYAKGTFGSVVQGPSDDEAEFRLIKFHRD